MKREGMFSKARAERIADLIDIYRLVPRIVLFGYAAMCWRAAEWFMALEEPTNNQAAFATLIFGFFVPLANFYMQNGRPSPTSSAAQQPIASAGAAPGTVATASVSVPDPTKK